MTPEERAAKIAEIRTEVDFALNCNPETGGTCNCDSCTNACTKKWLLAELAAETQRADDAAQDCLTVSDNYDALGTALKDIAQQCGKEWDTGYDERVVIELVRRQLKSLKAERDQLVAPIVDAGGSETHSSGCRTGGECPCSKEK